MRRLALTALLLALPAAQAATLAPSPHTAACFLDVDGDTVRGASEPTYLQRACGNLLAGDIRLLATAGFPGGSIVTGNDDDASRSTLALAAAYGFVDEDGSGTPSPGDPYVFHVGTLPGTAAPGDIPLTGEGAFQPITPAHPLAGRPLAPLGVAVGGESFAETDGNPGFSTGDVVYLDVDGDGVSSIGDLRLAFGTAPAPAPSSTAPAPSASTPASAPPAQGPTTPESSPAATGSPTSGTTGAPLGWAIPPVALLAALLAHLRRS